MSQLSMGLQAIFDSNRDDFQRRVDSVDAGVAAIVAGSLGDELRGVAERDAHKLAGSLGTFGLPRGSALASELERRFARDHPATSSDEAHLTGLVAALRSELDSKPSMPAATFESGLGVLARAPASRRILVVDDDPTVRQALALILADAGYAVREVGSAREARRELEHDKVDLLLSDVSMPEETGLDLIRFALCEHPQTATLLISALEDPGIAQVAMDYGAYGYLSKPVRRTAVLIGVMNALRRCDMEARELSARESLERTVQARTRDLSHALERLEATAARGRVLQAETIHRWALAAEFREPGISVHTKRMSLYCAALGRRLGMRWEALELASVLHDIGKVAVPDTILLKPGPLTSAERLTIETHSRIGYDMLRGSSSSLLDLAATIAWSHHEKFDGSGYPRGLVGAQIPIESRIAAVADVFDALTCDRVYRSAWSLEQTVGWMQSQSGRHFDPLVLDALMASMDEILAISQPPPGDWDG
ncbi:MAG TPA: HD domain-containing phosphohydrolase [Solirubrobacteraceae bacterium]|jgi:putative two-component system response regulator|nr:HD domain-containing phosphohydrolase [Solirubrobacteraceae bacterium]